MNLRKKIRRFFFIIIMKKFTIMSMFSSFQYETNYYSRTIMKQYEYIPDKNDSSIDIYIIGSFITQEDYKFIKSLQNKTKLLWISEPIYHHHYQYPCQLIQENEFHVVYGCVMHRPQVNRYKLPLYINYYKAFEEENYYNEVFFKNINEKCSSITLEGLQSKKFCTLIARHDQWNTRNNMLQELNKIKEVHCPSQLNNNCPNEELEKVGKHKFGEQFIFQLTPENSECNFPGYITEKIMDASLSCSIPIYHGKLDDIDKQIFNIERIIFFLPSCKENLEATSQKIKDLMENPELLVKFYQQPIFQPNAHQIIEKLTIDFKTCIDIL